MENSCYTYFKITGDFDPDKVTALLGLCPERTWKIGDLRRNGTRHEFALWEIGRCEDHHVIVAEQMEQTIAPLLDRVELLRRFKDTHDVYFGLEVVPTIYDYVKAPCLAPSLAVMDFCHATRTELDIDLYIMEAES